MIPQIFIPIAAQFSRPENKGRNVGIVLSGLLTGILASRVVSGFIGELIGWREMYHIAAGMMLICAIVVLKVLPDIQTNFQGKYSGLMKSLLALVVDMIFRKFFPSPVHIVLGTFYRIAQGGISTGYQSDNPGRRHSECRWYLRSVQHSQAAAGTCAHVKDASTLFHAGHNLVDEQFDLWNGFLNG